LKATTHTEVYRRFQGRLAPARLRCLPLLAAGVRVALKRKWPLLLYLPPFGAMLVLSFIVYTKFLLEEGLAPAVLTPAGANPGTQVIGSLAGTLIEVHTIVFWSVFGMGQFALLIAGWYGAGLIAEDRRRGAHLLYFARPLSKLDYLLGKLGVVACFIGAGVLVPALAIALTAVFAAPGWSFLTEHGSIFLDILLYTSVHTFVLASFMLAISSLFKRWAYAVVTIAGYVLLSSGLANLLSWLNRDQSWQVLSPTRCLWRLAASIFEVEQVVGVRLDWSPALAWSGLGGVVALSWLVLWLRVRRMESVA